LAAVGARELPVLGVLGAGEGRVGEGRKVGKCDGAVLDDPGHVVKHEPSLKLVSHPVTMLQQQI